MTLNVILTILQMAQALYLKRWLHYGLSRCSAFQVRIGGVKGVVHVDDKLENEDNLIRFRPS